MKFETKNLIVNFGYSQSLTHGSETKLSIRDTTKGTVTKCYKPYTRLHTDGEKEQ